MGAFHNDASIKETYLARVRQHRAADELIHGKYWENGRGCAVGCTIHSSVHLAYEVELGIPRMLAWLEDRIFEGLPNAKSLEWPEAFLSSIAVGADLSHVGDHFTIWLLLDEQAGLIRFVKEEDRSVLAHVAALYQRRLAGEAVTEDEWLDVRMTALRADDGDIAFAITDDSAYALASNTFANDTDDAALALAYAAIAADAPSALADAAQSAADAVARKTGDDTRYVYFVRMSEKLLELLASAPVPAEI